MPWATESRGSELLKDVFRERLHGIKRRSVLFFPAIILSIIGDMLVGELLDVLLARRSSSSETALFFSSF